MANEWPRREFLKVAGLSVAGAGVAHAAGRELEFIPAAADTRSPFQTLASMFEAPVSQYFGVKAEERFEKFGDGTSGRRTKLLPRDPKTLYLADGLDGEEEPHSFQLTFEISNHRILCSATQHGILRNPCIFSRVVKARRRGKDLMSEELLGGSAWSFGLLKHGGRPIRLPMTHGAQVELVGSLFPMFTYGVDGLIVRMLAFAPRETDVTARVPRAIIALVEIQNRGSERWQGNLLAPNIRDVSEADATAIATPVESPHPRFTELPVPIGPSYEAIMCLDQTRWSPRCPHVSVSLAPGERAISSFALMLGTDVGDLRTTCHEVEQHSALEWFNRTWSACESRYGDLAVPGAPQFAEARTRLVEGVGSAILYSDEGRFFGGGPSGCIEYGLMLHEPRFLGEVLRTLRDYQPGRDKTDLAYSLVNSLSILPSAALYYRATGDAALFNDTPGILGFARERLAGILALRTGGPFLFPSKMLWDGPTEGDFHTGSNVMAWLAFHGMARIARDVYGQPQLADGWEDAARQIKRDVYRYCVTNCRLGSRFVEGGNLDGTFAPGHNGEEAFTTLAPFFGFCEADDPALINHAKLALSEENPLYEPAVDGIWWGGRGEWGSGTTTPGQLAMLVGINSEAELEKRLEQLRGMTDLDGSIWWWPYLYPCNDRRNIRRRDWPTDTSKSGFTMAVASCLFVNNILGASADVPSRRVSLRPFMPWDEFAWRGARLGNARFDFAFKRTAKELLGRVTNLNGDEYQVEIELVLPPERHVSAVTVNGAAVRDAQATTRFGRSAVRVSGALAHSASLELRAIIA